MLHHGCRTGLITHKKIYVVINNTPPLLLNLFIYQHLSERLNSYSITYTTDCISLQKKKTTKFLIPALHISRRDHQTASSKDKPWSQLRKLYRVSVSRHVSRITNEPSFPDFTHGNSSPLRVTLYKNPLKVEPAGIRTTRCPSHTTLPGSFHVRRPKYGRGGEAEGLKCDL